MSYDPSGASNAGEVTISVSRQATDATSTSVTTIPLEFTLPANSDLKLGGEVLFNITDLGTLECGTLNAPASITETGCYHAASSLRVNIENEQGELQFSDDAISVAEGSPIALTFTRVPSGDLATVGASLPVDISRMLSITPASPATTGLGAGDFMDDLKIDYDGGTNNLVSFSPSVPLTNIKGFPGGASATSGVVLNFNNGGGAGNAKDLNTLAINTKNDDFVEGDEKFNLVIDPAGTKLLTTIGGKQFKINSRKTIAVTITSEDALTVTGATSTSIVETKVKDAPSDPTPPTYRTGIYTLTFDKGFESRQALAWNFTQKTGSGGTPTTLPAGSKVRLITSGANASTPGVTYASDGTLTLPANTAPITVAVQVDLLSTTDSDDDTTDVNFSLAFNTASINSGVTWAGSIASGTGSVKVDDADLNALTLTFGTAVGSWAGGEAVFIPSGDPRTRLYESQASSNPNHTVTATLSRALEAQGGTNAGMGWVVSVPAGLRIGPSANPSSRSFNLDFAVGDTTKTFVVRSTGSAADSTAAGFLTSAISAVPSFTGSASVHEDFVSDDTETIQHILLDDDNTFALDSTGVSVAEGAADRFLTFTNDGVVVTAPVGGSYTVTVHTEAATSTSTYPRAIPVTEYPASFSYTVSAGETINPLAGINENLPAFGSADNLITGDRHFALSHMVITPANRGATAQADGTQTPVPITLTDPTTAGRVGFSGIATLPAAAKHSLTSTAIGEGATKYPFNIVLDKAHRSNGVGTSGGDAPLEIKIAPTTASATAAGLDGADYIIEADGTPAGVNVTRTTTGAGETVINVSRKASDATATSLTTIPLTFVLNTDSDLEAGGEVLFNITELGGLECGTLNAPASITETGCYHAATVGGAATALSVNIENERGELQFSDSAISVAEGAPIAVTFNRVPTGDLASVSTSLPVDISRMVSITDASTTLKAADFDGQLQVDYDGAGAGTPADVTALSNIKGFPGSSIGASTGIILNFNQAATAGNAKDSNSLIIKTKDDGFVEGNETFNLVIDPAGTSLITTIGGKEFKINSKKTIAVTIRDNDNLAVTGATPTPIQEFKVGASTPYRTGVYTLTFDKGFETAKTLDLSFFQDSGSGTQDLAVGTKVRLIPSTASGAGPKSTAGVTYPAGGTTLTLPANTAPPIVVAVQVDLLNTADSDNAATEVGVSVAFDDASISPTYSGLNNNGDGTVAVLDADETTVVMEFPNTNAWDDGRTYYRPDKQTFYDIQRTSPSNLFANVNLSRPWPGDKPLLVTISVPAASSETTAEVNIAPTASISAKASFDLSFAKGEQTKRAYFRSTHRASATKEGYITTTITATPKANAGDGTPHTDLDTTASTIKYILMDTNNNFGILQGTGGFDVNEGDALTIKLANTAECGGRGACTGGIGTAVTAPPPNKFTITATATTAGAYPAATSSDYAISTAGVEVDGVAPADEIAGLITTTNDDYVTGTRGFLLTGLAVAETNRGVGFLGASTTPRQAGVLVEIMDDDRGLAALSNSNAYPTGRTGADDAAKASVIVNASDPLGEGDTDGTNFWVVLNKAHNSTGNIGGAGDARKPLIVRIAALASASSAGFTDDDYTLALVGTPAGVTLATHSAGGYSLTIERQSASLPSLSAVELKLTLNADNAVESGTGYLAIQSHSGSGTRALGPLDCGAPNSEAVSAAGTAGCYSIGAEGTTRYRVGIALADETGELKIAEVDGDTNDSAIEITEGTDTGFAFTLTRVPAGDLAGVATGLPVDISRLVSIENVSRGLTKEDFSGAVRIDYDGGVDDLNDLTAMSNIKGFPEATVTTSTGLVLNFNQATGAGNASDSNTLYFGINDDDLLEGDETFDLVIDPAGLTGGLVATVGGKPFKINGKKTIRVTIKSEDEMTVESRTITPITEAGGTARQTYAQGKFEITFTGAELVASHTGNLWFFQGNDELTQGETDQVKFVAGESTTGVVYNPTAGTYTLPAETSPMKLVVTIDLASKTTSDSKQTQVYTEFYVPNGWNVPARYANVGDSGDTTGWEENVALIDADVNAVQIFFGTYATIGTAVGSWGGGEDRYITADRKTRYNHQGTSASYPCGHVRLNQAWTSSNPLTVNLAVTDDDGDDSRNLVAIVADAVSNPSAITATEITLQFNTAANRERRFCIVPKTGAADGTAEGFLTATVTATPTLTHSGGTHAASLISTTPDSVKYIRLDDDNNFTIAEPTKTAPIKYLERRVDGLPTGRILTKAFKFYEVEEGGDLEIALADGVSVTAPTGENYALRIGTGGNLGGLGDRPEPGALLGSDYNNAPTATATTLAPGGAVSVPGFTGSDDDFINGNRYRWLTALQVTTLKRGASTTATSAVSTGHTDQALRFVRITDNDSANLALGLGLAAGYPTAGSGATAAEQATLDLGAGSTVTEGSTANFHIDLQKAHRRDDINNDTPLTITFTPVGTLPAGFTGADYSIALSGSPTGVAANYDATANSGKGALTVKVSRQDPNNGTSTSVDNIPFVLTLASDSDTETGGTVNFGITGLGHLECTALNEPDTVEQGCYHVGTVKVGTDRAPFQLAMDLVDETGELQISEVDSGANDNAIVVTEGTDNGFAITFTRIPTNDLASVAASLPVDISRMVSITGAGSASGITADDFVPNLQIDYNGGVDNLATLTPMTNIKGFPGGVSTSTGLVLNFNQGGGAGNADDANTLYFGIKDDDLIEADETFNLVIDPAGTALLATIAGKPFKISTRRVIAVTIKSEDNMTVAARTTTPVQEFGAAPNNQAYQQGELEVNFTGAELATAFTGEITFYDAGGDPISGVALATGVGKSTTGVVYTPATSRTNSTYTLPANTSPIKMVFEIDLPSETRSDGVQTIIYAEMNVPNTWVVTDLAQTGAPTGLSTRRIDVEVIDADINAAKVLFGAATGSWKRWARGVYHRR